MSNVSLSLVLDAVAKASVILAVAALAAAALRRASASARHFVWTLGLLSALAAPLVSVALPRWELPLVTIAAPAAPAIPAAPARHFPADRHAGDRSAAASVRAHAGPSLPSAPPARWTR
jgi:hypothetical protein